jgi:release factor glutamine methyltransferase
VRGLSSHVPEPPVDSLARHNAGTQPFGPLELLARAPVLIPRPETEDWALRLARAHVPSRARPARVLDLCTGSGCIALLLCATWPPGTTRALGVDVSPAALALARDNAAACGIATPGPVSESNDPPPPPHNTFATLAGDLSAPAQLARTLPLRPFTVLTANPPYIAPADYAALDASVRCFEDRRALEGPGADGLGLYGALADLVRTEGVLAPDAVVALEVGRGQAHAVRALVERTRVFRRTEVWTDPWGVERTVVAWTR